MKSISYDQKSPYYRTDQNNQYVSYLDFWSPTEIPDSVDDVLIILDSRYNLRPDLLSFDRYGTPQLWWVFAARNPDQIKDPIYDFKTNILIYAPTNTTIGKYV